MARTRIFGNASHLSGLLGEANSSYALGAIAEVSASNCEDARYAVPKRSSSGLEVPLDLSTNAQIAIISAIVLETDAQQPFADQFVLFWDLVEGGSFWSETGISNEMLFQM